jgi:succinate dehydrogenase / fumarate reductase flavoprotein subunit
MLVLAKVIATGALLRNESRGAHYKPEFTIPPTRGDSPAALRADAIRWCEAFKRQTEQWLKSTMAEHTLDGPRITYEPVDTSLIPPRPRTYGLRGAEIIMEVWREMQSSGQ